MAVTTSAMAPLDKPDIDEVVITVSGHERRVLPVEIWFDASAGKRSGEWKLKVFDPAQSRDFDVPMKAVSGWRPA